MSDSDIDTNVGCGFIGHYDSPEERENVKLRAALKEAYASISAMKIEKDEAYAERNHLVAALAHIFPSGIRPTAIEGWEPEWNGCCYIDLPTGQISYHYPDWQGDMFSDLPKYEKPWDGHDKERVHHRLSRLFRESTK